METLTATATAGRREWVGLAVLALPTLLLSLDMSVLFLALPHLSADLGASSTQQLWIMDSYGFMIAGFLVTMGTIGDRIGRRRLLMIGATCFSAASLVAAFAPTATTLILARAALGVAGATLMPSTLALIGTMFQDARQRGTAIAVWMSCFMVGTAVGPVVGGVLLQFFWWGSVFLLGVPVMVVLLLTGPRLLPEHRDPAPGRVDPLSVALSLLAILPFVYGLKETAKSGWAVAPTAALVAGLAFAAVFAHRQRGLEHPLLDLRLFADRAFTSALTVNALGAFVMGGTFLFVPTYLQAVHGLTPLGAGLWMLPQMVAMIAGSLLAPRIARRVRPAHVIAAGVLIGAVGLLLLTAVGAGGLPVLVCGFTLACVGIAPPSAIAIDLVLAAAPRDRAGAASGLSETAGEFGIAMGLAVMGTIGQAVYRAGVDVPPGVPEAAGESVGGALAVAPGLPPAVAADLMASAREAFTAGFGVVAALGAVLLTGLAVLALRLLR